MRVQVSFLSVMELVAHGSSRFCWGLCALQPTPSGLPYDPNMSEARELKHNAPANEFGTMMVARQVIKMNGKRDRCAYCYNCQRWILKRI